ncbi:hypothetical protein CDAR_168611 [Caerostris darwini]|uniref:Uncharacterized protein n=1 Tax=Caerostris darwini TaxID=1538125 RepID=A0AAV4T2V5_9ARAC|nr:hypothetical protein CDAR_168611 [Caerostris darwini]
MNICAISETKNPISRSKHSVFLEPQDKNHCKGWHRLRRFSSSFDIDKFAYTSYYTALINLRDPKKETRKEEKPSIKPSGGTSAVQFKHHFSLSLSRAICYHIDGSRNIIHVGLFAEIIGRQFISVFIIIRRAHKLIGPKGKMDLSVF